jgi:hypothetical protein
MCVRCLVGVQGNAGLYTGLQARPGSCWGGLAVCHLWVWYRGSQCHVCVVHGMACWSWGCRRGFVPPCTCHVLVDVVGHAGMYTGLQARPGSCWGGLAVCHSWVWYMGSHVCGEPSMTCESWGCRSGCDPPYSCHVLVHVVGHAGLYTGLHARPGSCWGGLAVWHLQASCGCSHVCVVHDMPCGSWGCCSRCMLPCPCGIGWLWRGIPGSMQGSRPAQDHVWGCDGVSFAGAMWVFT